MAPLVGRSMMHGLAIRLAMVLTLWVVILVATRALAGLDAPPAVPDTAAIAAQVEAQVEAMVRQQLPAAAASAPPATALDGAPVDAAAKTVSFTVASGLAAPSGTATVNAAYTSSAQQIVQGSYAASTSTRSAVNRFIRSQYAQSVLGYVGIIDLAAYLEEGGGKTLETETGKWKIYYSGGTPVSAGPTWDGTHPTSLAFEDAATQAANDNGVSLALAN